MGLPSPRTPAAVTAYVIAVLESSAQTPYIGEPISQLQHSLQCAALAAAASNPSASEETQVAALLHDIGQFAPEDDLQLVLQQEKAARAARNATASSAESTAPAPAAIQNMGPSASASVGRIGHEDLGAALLRALGFPDEVARLVAAHVPAKRYLCAVDGGYHAALSEASKKSLMYQGGPMSGVERARFESDPSAAEMCRLRRWDDEAKVENLDVGGLEQWRGPIQRVMERAEG